MSILSSKAFKSTVAGARGVATVVLAGVFSMTVYTAYDVLRNTPAKQNQKWFGVRDPDLKKKMLELAGRGEDPSVLVELLKKSGGIDAPMYNAAGQTTPLILLSSGEYFNIYDIVDTFIESGASLKAVNAKGETALHVAAKGKDFAVVSLLLARGADPNARDNKGRTAFEGFVSNANKNILIVKDAERQLGSKAGWLKKDLKDIPKTIGEFIRFGALVEPVNVGYLEQGLQDAIRHALAARDQTPKTTRQPAP
jgi:hypothetical protein